MQLNIKEQQILQYAMEHGIIDLADVSADVETMKKQEILKKYHYWQGSDGRFYFKYRDSDFQLIAYQNVRSVKRNCVSRRKGTLLAALTETSAEGGEHTAGSVVKIDPSEL